MSRCVSISCCLLAVPFGIRGDSTIGEKTDSAPPDWWGEKERELDSARSSDWKANLVKQYKRNETFQVNGHAEHQLANARYATNERTRIAEVEALVGHSKTEGSRIGNKVLGDDFKKIFKDKGHGNHDDKAIFVYELKGGRFRWTTDGEAILRNGTKFEIGEDPKLKQIAEELVEDKETGALPLLWIQGSDPWDTADLRWTIAAVDLFLGFDGWILLSDTAAREFSGIDFRKAWQLRKLVPRVHEDIGATDLNIIAQTALARTIVQTAVARRDFSFSEELADRRGVDDKCPLNFYASQRCLEDPTPAALLATTQSCTAEQYTVGHLFLKGGSKWSTSYNVLFKPPLTVTGTQSYSLGIAVEEAMEQFRDESYTLEGVPDYLEGVLLYRGPYYHSAGDRINIHIYGGGKHAVYLLASEGEDDLGRYLQSLKEGWTKIGRGSPPLKTKKGGEAVLLDVWKKKVDLEETGSWDGRLVLPSRGLASAKTYVLSVVCGSKEEE